MEAIKQLTVSEYRKIVENYRGGIKAELETYIADELAKRGQLMPASRNVPTQRSCMYCQMGISTHIC